MKKIKLFEEYNKDLELNEKLFEPIANFFKNLDLKKKAANVLGNFTFAAVKLLFPKHMSAMDDFSKDVGNKLLNNIKNSILNNQAPELEGELNTLSKQLEVAQTHQDLLLKFAKDYKKYDILNDDGKMTNKEFDEYIKDHIDWLKNNYSSFYNKNQAQIDNVLEQSKIMYFGLKNKNLN